MIMTTPEKISLIYALCNKLRWAYSSGGTRADHLQLALRLVELCKSLPEEGDNA